MSKGQGEFEYNEITNSVSNSKSFSRQNVFFINIINNTAFEVQVISRSTGEIRVPANSNVQFNGHPLSPAKVSYKIRFNIAAPTTDFIVILTSSVNSLTNQLTKNSDGYFKQC